MPGIVGLITKRDCEWAKTQLREMMNKVKHGRAYVCGTYIDKNLGIYVGWAGHSSSLLSKMPLLNEQGDRVLVMSGEEYPDPSLCQELKKQGHAFACDRASYLVHVSEEDRGFPGGLNGRFHGLLIDKAAMSAMLFNDRYGMHRLYYCDAPEGFFFAAEAKAILQVRPELRCVDEQGLAEFISCGCVLEDRTIFRNLHVLPTASAWTFCNGTLVTRQKYFSLSEWEEQGTIDPEEYYRQLRDVFSRNLPRYFSGPEKIGVSLTGGLDTRMIMAWSKAIPGSLPSYTFGGPIRECRDVIVARKVAEVCHQPYQVISVDNTFFSRFDHFAEQAVYLSDGCVGVNRGADLFANEVAAQIAPVRMTGNYGSEILRRIRVFKPSQPALGLFQPEVMKEMGRVRETYDRHTRGHAVAFTAFRQAPWYQHGLLSLEETQLTMRSPFLDNDLVKLAFRAPKSDIVKSGLREDDNECSRLIADGNPKLHRIPTDRGLGGSKGWAASIRRRYLEFTFKAEYAYDYGMPQWMARIDHALSGLHLENVFLGRHKFCHFRVWYRDDLREYVRQMLLGSKSLSRPYVNRKRQETIVREHLNGTGNYTTEITRLLTIELQHRLFIDGDSALCR